MLRSLAANAEWHGLGFLRGIALHSQLQHPVVVQDPHSPGLSTQLTQGRVQCVHSPSVVLSQSWCCACECNHLKFSSRRDELIQALWARAAQKD